MTPGYEDLLAGAQALVAAEAKAAAAQAALAAAQAAHDEIVERVMDLRGQRGAIVVRRKEGEHLPDDPQRLALYDADIEGLAQIQAERASAVEAARGPAEAAAAAAADARHVLRRAEALAAERAAVQYLGEIQAKLLAAIDVLADVGQQLGRHRSAWHPSAALADAVHRLRAETWRGW